MFTNFSKHSLKRLAQRTSLKSSELLEILDRKVYLNLGSIPGFNSAYLLIYIHENDDYIIVIQDLLNGTVITILRLEFQSLLIRKVTKQDCQKIKEQTLKDLEIKAKKVYSEDKKAPKKFLITMRYLDENNNIKAKACLKLKVSEKIYGNSMDELLESDYYKKQLFDDLLKIANSKDIKKENLFDIIIRDKVNEPLVISLKNENIDESLYLN